MWNKIFVIYESCRKQKKKKKSNDITKASLGGEGGIALVHVLVQYNTIQISTYNNR